jgi:hypothetical protein
LPSSPGFGRVGFGVGVGVFGAAVTLLLFVVVVVFFVFFFSFNFKRRRKEKDENVSALWACSLPFSSECKWTWDAERRSRFKNFLMPKDFFALTSWPLCSLLFSIGWAVAVAMDKERRRRVMMSINTFIILRSCYFYSKGGASASLLFVSPAGSARVLNQYTEFPSSVEKAGNVGIRYINPGIYFEAKTRAQSTRHQPDILFTKQDMVLNSKISSL